MVMGELPREADLVVLGGGPGRLRGRLPRGRPRARHGPRRGARRARRRVPPRRLHPVQGAPGHRRADPRRGRGRGRGRHVRPAGRRHREAARLDPAVHRPPRPGAGGARQGARRRRGAGPRALRDATARSACRGRTRRRRRSSSSTRSSPRARGPRRFPGSSPGPACGTRPRRSSCPPRRRGSWWWAAGTSGSSSAASTRRSGARSRSWSSSTASCRGSIGTW